MSKSTSYDQRCAKRLQLKTYNDFIIVEKLEMGNVLNTLFAQNRSLTRNQLK